MEQGDKVEVWKKGHRWSVCETGTLIKVVEPVHSTAHVTGTSYEDHIYSSGELLFFLLETTCKNVLGSNNTLNYAEKRHKS